ncbi:LOW QUALITY PROTEIN: transmembrane protein 54b [Brachyhypopomus gauderio]|uniref:LOW QUALITY PROTEIN: transmembrane protein 54b n=1 Tax=Brachyhypopomus gauderio TaxID=698409 RepID=UPI0040429A7D
MKMVISGLCCANLEEPRSLMKMGLCMVLVGHVNFLLSALVHGTVLRNVTLNPQTMEYAISNILALVAGLVGVIVGILVIVLSKREKSRELMWSVCVLSAGSGLLAAASFVGLMVSVVCTIIHGSKGLLEQCNLPDGMSSFSITDECPFDPTRIYSTTLILWAPLVVMSVVEGVFSGRCVAVCIYFLHSKPGAHCEVRSVKTLGAAEPLVLPYHAPPPRRCQGNGVLRQLERPLEQHELLHAAHPCGSTRSAPPRAPPPRFSRAALNRTSFWI